MERVKEDVRQGKSGETRKMGFDFRYFIASRCSVCSVYFSQSSDRLYISQCPDCQPELYGIRIES